MRIINRSVLIDDKIERKSFIIEDLKNTKIQESAYEDAVTKVNLGTFLI